VSSQLMGPRGRWRDWRGYGSNTQPVAGLTWLWDHPGRDAPVGANVALPDHIVGRLGAMAAMACLIGRQRTGRGAHVEIAQVEVVVNLLAEVFAREAAAPGSVVPQGNRSDRGAPWGVYPCTGTQRWCAITCRSDEEWERLRAAIGAPDSPQWATVEGRRADHDALDKHIAAWTSERSDRAVMEALQASGVAAGMMTYPSDMPSDPHLVARGFIRPLEQPGMGTLLVEGPSFTGSALPDVRIGPAPRLGEHTYEICRSLGLPLTGIDELVACGALFAPS
jgi:crotonobetainyl-CoA:carnitine CoA-transferase CaiB-like acyl-CoA transferase